MSNELKEPKASPAKVTYHLKQLRKLFLRASDQHFLQMVWAIDALRSGRPEAAAGWLTFPQQAADQSIGSTYRLNCKRRRGSFERAPERFREGSGLRIEEQRHREGSMG